MEENKEIMNVGPERKYAEKIQQDFCDSFTGQDYIAYTSKDYEELKRTIGYTLFGSPHQSSENKNEPWSYSKAETKKISEIWRAIVKFGTTNAIPKIIYLSIIHVVCEYSDKGENVGVYPIFCVRKCSECRYTRDEIQRYVYYLKLFNHLFIKKSKHHEFYCRVFIDHEARVYKSWDHYLKTNTIRDCTMIIPKNGKYTTKNKRVVLDEKRAPKTTALRTVDIIENVMSSTGPLLLMALPAIPVVEIGVMGLLVNAVIYESIRSVINIVDRHEHGQTLSITNGEARSLWMNIVEGILTIASMGALHCQKLITKVSGKSLSTQTTVKRSIAAMSNISKTTKAALDTSALLMERYLSQSEIQLLELILLVAGNIVFSSPEYKKKLPVNLKKLIDDILKAYSKKNKNQKNSCSSKPTSANDASDTLNRDQSLYTVLKYRKMPEDEDSFEIIQTLNYFPDSDFLFSPLIQTKIQFIGNELLIKQEPSPFRAKPSLKIKVATFPFICLSQLQGPNIELAELKSTIDYSLKNKIPGFSSSDRVNTLEEFNKKMSSATFIVENITKLVICKTLEQYDLLVQTTIVGFVKYLCYHFEKNDLKYKLTPINYMLSDLVNDMAAIIFQFVFVLIERSANASEYRKPELDSKMCFEQFVKDIATRIDKCDDSVLKKTLSLFELWASELNAILDMHEFLYTEDVDNGEVIKTKCSTCPGFYYTHKY